MSLYADLHSLDEDKRIDLIGHTVMEHDKTVAFIVEDNKKADRYIEKLKLKFPGIVIVGRLKGPVKGTVAVNVGPPNTKAN